MELQAEEQRTPASLPAERSPSLGMASTGGPGGSRSLELSERGAGGAAGGAHNFYRGQVSPSASAMMPLKWDPNLKVIAEGYAAQCVWSHNPTLGDTGENLFAGTGPLDLRVAMEKWFLERQDYDFANNSCDEDKMCGHYTQMVWADTHRVGCAFHLCSSMVGLGWERVSFLVCNYYPAGNYEDVRPYVEGDWCSRCPELPEM
ncbi:Peptidase inhibitor 16 [Larimichthys crocea]|uniref:Peptidase inhibitor 16 n=1 Tax=Larimichthys crocea TaxID=215358 RepID=A0A6G0IN65_LARCR|nr:Peptidase inhibitor 16 [Larimichthys crocea]